MKHIFILALALCSLTANAQNQVVKRHEPKKETMKVTSSTSAPKKQAAKKRQTSQRTAKPNKNTVTNTVVNTPVATLTAVFENGVLTANGVRYKFEKIEGCTFTMGATPGMFPISGDLPTHKVTLTHNYYMGSTEVTQALWKAVMGNNPSEIKGDNLPVVNVSWYDCQTFISKLNNATGQKFRLPTEAEWELAARGGKMSQHYLFSGSNNLNDVAWYKDNSSNTLHDVATKEPNELGLYDLSGNVDEWCTDFFCEYAIDNQYDPAGPINGTRRVIRSSAWNYDGYCCCPSSRQSSEPSETSGFLGLRLVVTTGQSTSTNIDISPKPQKITYETFNVKGVTFEMAKVEAGNFIMGATSEQQYSDNDEKPAHQVMITKNYYIGKTEVTQALWKAVMGKNPSKKKGNNRPVENVSRNDCQTFISKLNAATGKDFRLPTEAEWEFAARGGNNSRHYQYSGSNNLYDVAWYTDNSGNTTYDVASKQPNELGLYDMSGNVWEWCSDWYGSYSSNTQYDPAGPTSGSYRMIRGGSWRNFAWYCRSSDRFNYGPDYRSSNLGLRLALSE